MSASLFLERVGKLLTLACLFFLPWQTRYIFFAPLVGVTESEFGVTSLYVTMLLAGIAAASWWIGGRRKNGGARYLLPFICALPLIALFLIMFPSPSCAWALNGGFSIFLGYATYKTAYQNSRATAYAVLAGLIFALGLGIWQMIAGWSPASSWLGLAVRSAEHLGDSVILIEGQRILRMYGSFPHPNIFGTAIAVTFGAMCSRSCRIKTRILGIILVFIVSVLFCISRSAALAMTCAFIVYLGLSHKNLSQQRVFFSIALLLPVLIWVLQFVSPSLLALRGQSFIEQQSISERVMQVGEWWRVMERGAVWGVGVYKYPQALADIEGASLPAWAYQPVHNIFLLVIAEIGIAGCGVVGLGLCIAMKAKENRRQTVRGSFSSPAIHYLSSAALPLLTTLYVLSLFDHALWTSWSGMSYTAVAIALVFAGEESRISTLSQGVLDEKK